MKEEDRMKHYIEQTQKIERDINILKKWKKEAEENAKVETEPILRAYYDGKSEGFYEAIALAEDTQRRINTVVESGWISTADRMPEDGKNVIVTAIGCDGIPLSDVGMFWADQKDWWTSTGCRNVTAWMPLPLPYREEQEDA